MRGPRERAVLGVVLDQMPIGVLIVDAPGGAVIFQNAEADALLGREYSDIDSAERYAEFGAIHETGALYTADEYPIMRALKGAATIRDEIVLYRKPDGAVLALRVSADVVRDEQGDVIAAVATFLDVTAERANEAARADSEARLRAALEATTDGVIVLDRNGRLLFLNDAARTLLRDAPLDIDIVEGEPELPCWTAYREALAQQAPAEVEARFPPLDRVFRARAFPSGETITVFFQDVSDEAALEQLQRDLTGELIHRIGNIFTLISSMIKLSARSAQTPAAMADTLGARISALAKAHALVRPQLDEQIGTTLDRLMETLLAPHIAHGAGAADVKVPAIPIGPHTTTTLAMALHELATNSAKYGALGAAGGQLNICGEVEDGTIRIDWREVSPQPIAPIDTKTGFGTNLVDSTIKLRLKGSIERDWRKDGLTAVIHAPLDTLSR